MRDCARGHESCFWSATCPGTPKIATCPQPPYGRTALYASLEDLQERFTGDVRDADAVIVGSYVPEGVAVGRWVQQTAQGVTAFYDIDTPVTLAKLARGDFEYVSPGLDPRLRSVPVVRGRPGARAAGTHMARPAPALYCSVDPDCIPRRRRARMGFGVHGHVQRRPAAAAGRAAAGAGRQWPQGRFVVAGPQYPPDIAWPANVARIEHLPPAEHRAFYNRQQFTLNVTRADMIALGYSPSVRLFEAAACGVPILSDYWDGLDTFFALGTEILVTQTPEQTLRVSRELPEDERQDIGARARARVLAAHTAAHRAAELETICNWRRDRTREHSRRHRTARPLVPQPAPAGRHADLPRPLAGRLSGLQVAADRAAPARRPDGLAGAGHRLQRRLLHFRAGKRGAQVAGIDVDARYLAQARWAAEQFGLADQRGIPSDAGLRPGPSAETFDLVLFMGVFYHLRYPLLALDLVAQKVKRCCVFQTLTMPGETVTRTPRTADPRAGRAAEPGWPKMAFLEHKFAGDPTNWWAANRAGVEAMLRSSGLRVTARPGHEL